MQNCRLLLHTHRWLVSRINRSFLDVTLTDKHVHVLILRCIQPNPKLLETPLRREHEMLPTPWVSVSVATQRAQLQKSVFDICRMEVTFGLVFFFKVVWHMWYLTKWVEVYPDNRISKSPLHQITLRIRLNHTNGSVWLKIPNEYK